MSVPEADGFLPLTDLAFHLLLSLGREPAHGYALGKEIEERTGGRLKPTTGGLYQALKRLRDDGLVERAPGIEAEAADSRRNYFRLTPLGRRVLAAEAGRLDELVARARELGFVPDARGRE